MGMSDATVPDLSDEPLSVRAKYPDPDWWNTDTDARRDERVEELRDILPESDVVGIVDSDADGLACEATLRETFSDENVVCIHGRGGEYGFNLPTVFQMVAENTTQDTTVIIADLAPNFISTFTAGLEMIPGETIIVDHHNWKWNAHDCIEQVSDELYLQEDKCASMILQNELYQDAPDSFREFIEITDDHDRWIKEDDRSDILSTLAFTLDRDEYVYAARNYGAEMWENDSTIQDAYETAKEESEKRIDIAMNEAEWHEISDKTVAVTYLDCNHSTVGNNLVQDGADIAVIIKPWQKVSFRSVEEKFTNCDTLAANLDGGGHDCAAGASIYPDVTVGFETTWETGGETAKEFIVEYLESELTE